MEAKYRTFSQAFMASVLPRLVTVLRYAVVFFLLLCVAEVFLLAAVYLGYSGGTYFTFKRVTWKRDGTLTFSELMEVIGRPLVNTMAPPTRPRGPLPPCPLIPPGLQGPVVVDTKPGTSFSQLAEDLASVLPGGRHWPEECAAKQRLAIVIPFRDRQAHLKIFLRHMHPFLQRQQLDYQIFVIELKSGVDFNRAMLFNIGFREAQRVDNFTCFIFHDVDLLPEDDRNLYRCGPQPRHMSVAVDKMKYKLPYNAIFGGVSALTKDQFEHVNGFSNSYFGWGGEDDDMFKRIHSHNWKVVRYAGDVARYKSLGHAKDKPNPERFQLLKKAPKRMQLDGLSSLDYTRLNFEIRPLYTWVLVDMDKAAVLAAANITEPDENKK